VRRLTLLIAVALVAPAHAATVRVRVVPPAAAPSNPNPDPQDRTVDVVYTASDGERNRPLVRRTGSSSVIVSDPGVELEAGARCSAADPHRVHCRLVSSNPPPGVRLLLGDGADRVDPPGLPSVVYGGPGDDVIRVRLRATYASGGPGRDVLSGGDDDDYLAGGPDGDEVTGGNGEDTLEGGTARDVLRGGAGDDLLASSDHARDGLYGGPGRDLASYADGDGPVTAVLSSGAGDDDLVGIEDLFGSSGDDRLSGDAGPNQIVAMEGADDIRAEAGDDSVTAGPADEVGCGGGDDVEIAIPTGLLRPGCEAVSTLPAQPLAVDADAVTMQVPCEPRDVTLTTPPQPRRWFDSGPFGTLVASGTTQAGCKVVLRLTEAGRTLPRPLPVTLSTGWSFVLQPASSETSAP
jgi:hypothetical protein